MRYDADAFMYVMRTGKGGTLSGVMPWATYRHLSDDDLSAIHAFLRTMHPFMTSRMPRSGRGSHGRVVGTMCGEVGPDRSRA